MYNEPDKSIYKNLLMLFITMSPDFAGSSVEQQLIGWHMSHIYGQLPFTQLSYETAIVNPQIDSDKEIQQIMSELAKNGHDVSNHVVPCVFTNYKELKNPITNQIKPLFSYSKDMQQIMGAPYSGVIVISGKDAERMKIKMDEELKIMLQDSLKQYKNFRILYNNTEEDYGGVYVNIYLNNYYIYDHINVLEDDSILSVTKAIVVECDHLNSLLNQYLLSRRFHQNNKIFQSTEGKKFVRVQEKGSLVSITIKHDIIDSDVAKKNEFTNTLFERDIDAITKVINYFGLTKYVSIDVEDIDQQENRFTTKFTIKAIEKKTIDLATLEEFLYVLKKSYEFQIYNYVTYSDTELYKRSDFQPVDIKVTPEI